MKKRHSIPLSITLSSAAVIPTHAAELSLKIQLPEITTGQYVRPYVAVWLEKADGSFVKSLTLWHEMKDKRGNPVVNDKYLKSLREWWSKSGASADMKFDSISSATRPAGQHELLFTPGKEPLDNLAPGNYQLMVEVAREIKAPRTFNGGDKPVKNGKDSSSVEASPALSFTWPVKQATTVAVNGKNELAEVALSIKP